MVLCVKMKKIYEGGMDKRTIISHDFRVENFYQFHLAKSSVVQDLSEETNVLMNLVRFFLLMNSNFCLQYFDCRREEKMNVYVLFYLCVSYVDYAR